MQSQSILNATREELIEVVKLINIGLGPARIANMVDDERLPFAVYGRKKRNVSAYYDFVHRLIPDGDYFADIIDLVDIENIGETLYSEITMYVDGRKLLELVKEISVIYSEVKDSDDYYHILSSYSTFAVGADRYAKALLISFYTNYPQEYINAFESYVYNNVQSTTINTISEALGISEDQAKTVMSVLENDAEIDEAAISMYHQMFKSKQKLQDKCRVLTKYTRSDARYTNAIEELLNNVYTKLDMLEFYSTTKPIDITKDADKNAVGIIQLSDLHLNEVVELVDTNEYNAYNYDVACKRLTKLLQDSVRYFDSWGIKKVVVVNTGDILNSDRRYDEIVTNAGNRSVALLLAVDILAQFLNILGERYYVSYITTLGNESRKNLDITWTTKTFSNNYDYDVYLLLSHIIRSPNIQIVKVSNAFESYFSINGFTFMATHGVSINAKDPEKDIAKLFSKAVHTDKKVDYILFGHVHSALATDWYSRGSSLVGSNSYSNNKLGLVGKASQNIYIVTDTGITSIIVDLQDVSGVKESLIKYDTTYVNEAIQHKSREKVAKEEACVEHLVVI